MRPRARFALVIASALLAAPALAACSSNDDGDKAAPAPTATRTLGAAPAAVQDAPADDSVDAGFARDMRTHHAQAVQMAMMVRDLTQDDATRKLAYDIALTQQEQIGRMAAWLQMWGLTIGSSGAPMQWMSPGSMPEHTGHTGHDATASSAAPSASPSVSSSVSPSASTTASPVAEGELMPGMATQAQLDQLTKLRGKDAEVMFLQLMITHHQAGVAMARDGEAHAQVQQVRDLANTMVVGQSAEIDLMRTMLAERGAS